MRRAPAAVLLMILVPVVVPVAISAATNMGSITGTSFTALAAGGADNLVLGADLSTVGSLASTVTLGCVSNINGVAGLTETTLASGSISTSGYVYSGAGVWKTNTSDNWVDTTKWTAAEQREQRSRRHEPLAYHCPCSGVLWVVQFDPRRRALTVLSHALSRCGETLCGFVAFFPRTRAGLVKWRKLACRDDSVDFWNSLSGRRMYRKRGGDSFFI